MENTVKGTKEMSGIIVGIIGIAVTVVSIIVTLISIRQTCENNKHQKSNRDSTK